jgi:hypothetical protein
MTGNELDACNAFCVFFLWVAGVHFKFVRWRFGYILCFRNFLCRSYVRFHEFNGIKKMSGAFQITHVV